MRSGEVSTTPETLRFVDEEDKERFAELRSLRWRIHLGVLPKSVSIDDLRRVTADSRRRYARLRRSLLVDPHLRKDATNSPQIVIDDPLSQNPDSMWGHFFRSAELEKMVDQDLSRLYPEHGSFFQSPMCQSMLRRILLLWCLRHPDCGYRQGMHELLAPFLYVLHVDTEQLSKVQNHYKGQFTEHFELAFPNYESTDDSGLKKFSDSKDDCIESQNHPTQHSCFDDIDPKVQTIISLSDAYGAEGELGTVLSLKFMEHDAYCMFDALMSGSHGIAMSDFFSPAPVVGSQTGLPPIIEASSALYHMLSIADASVYDHLVELGVEPQYFGIRWLRVLFGREFSLANLLEIWDEILASDSSTSTKGNEDTGSTFAILTSPQGAFIAAFGLSMMLHLRSSLLAAENATSCLQRLLNFPGNISLTKLIGKAKSLKTFAMEANAALLMTPSKGSHYRSKSMFVKGHNVSTDTISPTTVVSAIPESYWEEKWRFIQKAEELSQTSSGKKVSSNKKRWSDKVNFLSRTESDPSSSRAKRGSDERISSIRRNLLADLSNELGLDEDNCNSKVIEPDTESASMRTIGKNCVIQSQGCSSNKNQYNNDHDLISAAESVCGRPKDHCSDSEKSFVEIDVKDHRCVNHDDDTCSSGTSVSTNNQFSSSASENGCARPNDHETRSDRSSDASDFNIDGNSDEPNKSTCEEAALEVGPSFEDTINAPHTASENDENMEVQYVSSLKDRKPSGKFQWLWRFGRNASADGSSENGNRENSKSTTEVADSLTLTAGCNSHVDGKKDCMKRTETTSLKNLSHSMLQNIQVIESVLHPDNGRNATSLENISNSKIVDKGQLDVIAALRELREISNLLSEM